MYIQEANKHLICQVVIRAINKNKARVSKIKNEQEETCYFVMTVRKTYMPSNIQAEVYTQTRNLEECVF